MSQIWLRDDSVTQDRFPDRNKKQVNEVSLVPYDFEVALDSLFKLLLKTMTDASESRQNYYFGKTHISNIGRVERRVAALWRRDRQADGPGGSENAKAVRRVS